MYPSLATAAAALLALLPATVLAKPEQIRAVQEPIFHYYLQAHPDDVSIPVMGPEASSEYFTIAATMQSANTSRYLNIDASATATSYKPLFLTTAADTDAWALEGDTLITATDSAFGRQLNFLVCRMEGGGGADYWQVYLQTGSEAPEGRTCSNYQSLHLPCLC
ncbi:hypothetical protein F4780DRAFT_775171 [Xylariomycetidae sp. FL0641]|nr:hypothetical protein F4780DRAFT_775171 [Xylariomycetidae sp. FL0641]